MATAPTDPVPHGARNWSPDELDGFERTTLTMPDASDGPVEVVVVRRCDAPAHAGTRAFLYVHGFGDYFFQQHLADTVQEAGFRFHAVDLRRHGRSLRPHQLPNVTFDVDEYVADVAAAVRLLVDDGVREIVLNGHSTGGLVAVLYAHRGEGREHLSSVVLTSPFLDMNLPAWQERLVEPVLAFAGRFLPKVALGGLSPVYGQSIHADLHGEWRFRTDWKPIEGFPARLGWLRAIHLAQREVERGLAIGVPVLLLHAERSARPRAWQPDANRADIVLDVDDMVRLAPRLGPRVELQAVPDGMHDLVLSSEEPRRRTLDLIRSWLIER